MKRKRREEKKGSCKLKKVQNCLSFCIDIIIVTNKIYPESFDIWPHCSTVNNFRFFLFFRKSNWPKTVYSVWKSLTNPHHAHVHVCMCESSYTFLKIVNIKLVSFMSNKNVWHQTKRYFFPQAQSWNRKHINTQREIRWPEHGRPGNRIFSLCCCCALSIAHRRYRRRRRLRRLCTHFGQYPPSETIYYTFVLLFYANC